MPFILGGFGVNVELATLLKWWWSAKGLLKKLQCF